MYKMLSHYKFVYQAGRLLVASLITMLVSCDSKLTGYEMEFQVGGLKKDDVLQIGFYHEETQTVIDSSLVSDNLGSFRFVAKDSLPPGMYFIAYKNENIFDFLVDKDQFFTMKTSLNDPVGSMKVFGDIGNKGFYKDLRKSKQMVKKLQPMINQRRSPEIDEAIKDSLKQEIEQIKEQFGSYLDNRHEQLQAESSFLKYVNSQRDALPDIDAIEDPKDLLKYARQHFWDYFNLSDPFSIRLSKDLYRKKIKTYLWRLYYPKSDSLIVGVENVIAQARVHPETYKYTIKYLLDEFSYTDVNRDGVFVHLYEKYLASGDMDYWIDDKLKAILEQRAKKVKRSFVGQKATNFKALDYKGNEVSIHGIESEYTLLMIFDMTCDNCVAKIPKLKELKTSYGDQVKIIAIDLNSTSKELQEFATTENIDWILISDTDQDIPVLKESYNTYGTPTMYLLNASKEFVARETNNLQVFEDIISKKSQ